jgi:predicted anti-sigma-YlaC factor YlaD
MVSCQEVLDHLSESVDGTIEPKLRKQIIWHLRMCRKCRVMHDTVRQMLVIVADDRVFEIPDGYSERLHAAIERHLRD